MTDGWAEESARAEGVALRPANMVVGSDLWKVGPGEEEANADVSEPCRRGSGGRPARAGTDDRGLQRDPAPLRGGNARPRGLAPLETSDRLSNSGRLVTR